MISQTTLLRTIKGGSISLAVAAILFAAFTTQAQSQDAAKDGQPQVLTRGPIHEAFATPVTFDPKPGASAPRMPPPLVDELPPDQKPDGDNVAWIPGYYQWDEERKNFVWISGFWRVMPPGRKWIPGYWNKQDDNSSQWVSGYWAAAEQAQVEYLPAPPPTLETGPQNQAPGPNYIWTPGCYVYRDSHWWWRPGFYVAASPGWIWMPAYYAYTPCGYVYVDGYWDWSVRRRGVIFAPCYWSAWSYRPVYVYRPTVCIDVDIVTDHFFCRTGYGCYYFGDYYGGTYVSLGFSPWFKFHYARGGGYCPVYAYNAWYFRSSNPRWEIELSAGYDYRFRNVDARPPRTYVAQVNIINKTTVINNTTIVNKTVVAKPITQIAADSAGKKDAPMHFAKIDASQQKQFKQQGMESQQLVQKRFDMEKQASKQLGGNVAAQRNSQSNSQTTGNRQPLKLDMPKSPIVAKPADKMGSGADIQHGDGTKISSQPPEKPGQGNTTRNASGTGTSGSGGAPTGGTKLTVPPGDGATKPAGGASGVSGGSKPTTATRPAGGSGSGSSGGSGKPGKVGS